MNTFQIVILIALLGNTVLGLFVLLANPRRVLNVGFGVLSALILNWLGSLFFASIQQTAQSLLFWVRQTSSAAGFLPFGFFFVYYAVISSGVSGRGVFFKLRYWLLACGSISVLCHSSIFAVSATPASLEQMVPASEYGWGFILYLLFFAVVMALMTVGFVKSVKKSTGVQKVELQFLQIGGAASLFFGVTLLATSVFLKKQELGRFVPLSVLLLDSFVAYGIATRRIMAASEVLQRVVSYLLMTVYLVCIYIVSVWAGLHVFRFLVVDPSGLAHLLAALVLAFSVIPAQGWMQKFSCRLFSSANQFDVNRVLEEAGHVFQEVTTEETLMASFSSLIIRVFRTTRVVVLTPQRDGSFQPYYVFPEKEGAFALERCSRLMHLLNRDHEPFTVDTLERMRSSFPVVGARAEMRSSGASVAIGSFAHKKLEAIVLLFPKSNGAIYDVREQRALQLLCDQLAVSLENSNLYTAVQNSKIYNEILLDSMASGIVAVDEDHKVTVFNQRAQTITGLNEEGVVDNTVTVLPGAMVNAIETILDSGAGFRDKDMMIPANGKQIPIRVSGSIFHSHTGETLGALLVFSDMTLLRKMEDQIRRTDRLSSIGTLSAGMAHEIRNPLVTIRTFTDLLPQQYNDTDFRETFFDLVGQEVQRIDAIVNRLLNFARPAKASLKPTSLHEVVENSIRLVEQQLLKHEITLDKKLTAERYMVHADAEQLNQAFVNFFLNAIQAMTPGGTLWVSTSLSNAAIQLDVRDTGCGVSEEQRRHIFDPFFTTKETGVGLGLSVSHGIIQEHKGTIDVESREGRGTVFHVQLPLMDK